MELIWNEIAAPRLILLEKPQVLLEGAIPLPAGKDAAELIDYTAEAQLDSCRAETAKLSIDGRLTVRLIAADSAGEVFAFTSESPFSHTLTDAAIEPGMAAEVLPALSVLTVRRAPDGKLMLSAALDLDCAVISAAPVKALSRVNGVADMEIRTGEAQLTSRRLIGTNLIHLSDELSCDGADEVISSDLRLSVRDTAFENGGVTVSGVAVFTALCRSAGGELSQLSRSLPFRESVETDGTAEEVYAFAEVKNCAVRALGTEFSLVSAEADIELRVCGLRSAGVVLPLDAFSPGINFNCIKQKSTFLSVLGGAEQQHTVRENVTVPDGMPDIFTPLYVSARPVVTSAELTGGEFCIDGLLPTRLVYRSAGGGILSFTEDVPFSVSAAAPSGAVLPRLCLSCSCSITGGSGRTAQIGYQLTVSCEFWSELETELVVGLAEQNAERDEPSAERISGLIIHTAGEGETIFDIAKRFRVPTKTVRGLNPDLPEQLAAGEKILLVI